MLQLTIANKNYSSWSLRPWLLMQHLGIACEERLVPFGEFGTLGADGTPAISAVSPTGKVPCLVDTARGLTVWDSLAIVEYLAEQHPGVWPADVAARAWARSACAEMHAGFGRLRDTCTMNCGLRVRIPQPWHPGLLAEWRRMDALWCEGLQRFGGPWLAGGRFTAVDAFFAPVAFRVQSYQPPLGDSAAAYAQRLLALPAMQAWYAAGLAEPWRDAAHEDEARAAGTWLADLRQPV